MKYKLTLTLIVALSTFESYAQRKKQFTISELKDSIQVLVNHEHIAGLMLGITTSDSVLFTGGFGYADVTNKRAVNANTLFRMGSITKMFISLGIMKLVEDGKLNLHDELKSIAPEVPFINAWEASSPIRIVDLLEHTSGFDDIKLNHMYSLDTTENRGLNMVLVQKSSLITRWKPGERTAYSNPNYAILGYLLEKFSGKTYGTYLNEIILTPLGMHQSNFNAGSKYPDRETHEYIFDHGKFTRIPSVTLLSGPQGSLWSSAEDMTKFVQLFLRNENPIVKAGTLEEIETPHSSLAAQLGLKSCYALGNRIGFLTRAYSFRGHNGLTGTCHSGCFYNRDLGMGFVISANSNQYPYSIEQLVLTYLEQNFPPKMELDSRVLDQNAILPFTGLYQFESPRNEIVAFFDKFQNIYHIYIEDGQLFSKPLIGSPIKLIQTSPYHFTFEGMNAPLIVFAKNGDNNIMSIAGTYYEQKHAIILIIKIALFAVVLLLSLSAWFTGMITIISALLKKSRQQDLVYHLSHVIAWPLLVYIIHYLLGMRQNSYKLYEMTTINPQTLIVFMGTVFFGIASLLFLGCRILRFRLEKNRWFAWCSLLGGIAMCSLSILLWQAGWLGLRTWAM